MISFDPVVSKKKKPDTRQLFIDTFRRQLTLLEKGTARFRIPQRKHLYERHPKMAYHFKPELFIQLGGTTEFFFPDERFILEPGEICIMPKGVPHGEIAGSNSREFENVVVCYYNETVAIHVAHESPPGHPIVDDIFFFTTKLFPELVEYLNRICEISSHSTSAADTAVKGLLLAELALLLSIVQESEAGMFSETDRVFRCQWLIRNNIADPELSVESLADHLRCSPTHLSKLFHHETGKRIVEYIMRIRLTNAIDAMQHTMLSVKEIAAACGFSDPNYFARVFRKLTGRSPMEYRQDIRGASCVVEQEPKVVYFDREERDFGLRPEVIAKAKVRMGS